MAIAQTGSTLTFPITSTANTGTVSSTITVPADAEFVAVSVSGYQGTANGFAAMTFTKGGVDTAMTKATNSADASNAAWQGAIFYLALPDTGANKTLKWDWTGTGTSSDANMLFSVTFWKGIDTSSPVRSSGQGQSSTTPPYTTGTLTCVSGDLTLAAASFFANDTLQAINTWTNLTELVDLAQNSTADGALATASPSGNGTVEATSGTASVLDGGITAIVIKPATAKTLTAGAGSYAVTGTAASLELGREVVAGAGSYTLTGTNASLELGREVVADAGSYTLTGTDASLELGREVVAGAGSYALSGTDATLITSGIDLVAGAGSYALTGTDASLELGREVVADAGSYTLGGTDASLEFGREIVAGVGSYALSGTDASLELGREVVAGVGSYALSGTDATLTYSGAGSATTSVGDWGGGERPRARWPKARGLEQTQESIERRRREAQEAKERLKAVEVKAESVKAKVERARQIGARAKREAAVNRLAREQERIRLLLISTQERVVDAEAKLRQAEAMQRAMHRMAEQRDEEEVMSVLSSVQRREEAAVRSALDGVFNILREF